MSQTESRKPSRRTPPPAPALLHAAEMEQAMLGAMLCSSSAAEYGLGHLSPPDFEYVPHQLIFSAMQALAGRGETVEAFLVLDELKRHPHGSYPSQAEAVGGLRYLDQLTEQFDRATPPELYAARILDESGRRHARERVRALDAALEDREQRLAAIVDQGCRTLAAILDMQQAREKRIFSAPELLAELLPEPLYTVPGLLTEGLFLLIGKAKMGKSWLAYQIGISIAAGGRVLGTIPVERGRVLYLALEDTKRRLKKRLLKLLGDGEQPDLLDIAITWRRSDDGGIAELDAYCRQHPDTRLIIIDVLSRFRPYRERSSGNGAYLDDYADLGAIQEIAHRHGLTVLVIHHTNKGKEHADVTDSFSGSRGVSGAADGWWVLKRERGRPYAILEVDGRDIEEPREFAVEWDPHTAWTLKGDASEYIHTQEEREVIDLLLPENGSVTRKTLSLRLGLSLDTAGKRLLRMEDRGILVSEDGAYRLAAAFLADHARTTSENNGSLSSLSSCPLSSLSSPARLPYADEPETEAETAAEWGTRDSKDRRTQGQGGQDPPVFANRTHLNGASQNSTGAPGPEPSPDATLRWAVRSLALARGFPPLDFGEGRQVPGGEASWARFCASVSPEWLDLARERLLSLSAAPAPDAPEVPPDG